jgi:phosphoglycerate dehydrogenase-like enzyme
MTRVVLMEDYLDHARSLACVRELAERVDLHIYTERAASESEVIRRLAGAEAAITIRDRVRFPATVLSRLPALRLLSVCGPRLAPHVDLPAATRAGILVSRPVALDVPQIIHQATAELVWSLILGLTRHTVENQLAMRSGGWQTRLGFTLAGKTLGVIGLGRVGALVAKMGSALGMKVLAWSPRLTPERAASWGAEAVSFEQVLKDAHVVTLHANATDDSAGLIGRAEFAQMRRGAYFINTARAALVDEAALRDALDCDMLAAVGLDVYWEEPLPREHWLRKHPKVLMQPHMGGFTEEGYAWLLEPAVRNVLAYLDGAPKDVANPEVLGADRSRR